MAYPASIDSITRPEPDEFLDDPSHVGVHDEQSDAIEAIEEKVGIDGSVDPLSLDYRAAQADAHMAATSGAHSATAVSIITAGMTHTDAAEVEDAIRDLDAAVVGSGISPNMVDAPGDQIVGSADNTVTRRPRGPANYAWTVNAAGTELEFRDVYALPQALDTVQADSFTIALDQVGQWITCEADDIAARLIVLPQDSDVAYPIGCSTVLEFTNDVEWTISAGAGASIFGQTGVEGGPRPTGNGAIVVLFKRGANEWRVFGDIVTERLEADEHGFHPMRLSPPFTDLLNTAWSYNTNPNAYHRSVVEESTPGTRRLWAITVNSVRKPRLHRRTTLSHSGTTPSAWTSIDLSTKFTASGGVIDKNNHCAVAMHIDSDGYTHVLGGMLGHPISGHYCVSRVPYSMTLADYVPALFESGATNNTIMTYPLFAECSDGSFVLLHRDSENESPPGDGGPGNTQYFVRRYIPNGSAPPASGTNSRWQTRVMLVDGINDPNGSRGPYFTQVVTDPRDRATHWLFFWWRVESSNLNERLACIVTHDDFATFEKPDGTPLTLPIDTSDYTGSMVVDNLSESFASFLVYGACVDWVPMDPTDPNSPGRPHVLYTKNESGVVMQRAYWDGTWVKTSLGAGMATTPNRSSIVSNRSGGTFVIFSCDAVGKTGTVRLFDVTPGTAFTFADTEIIDTGFLQNDIIIPQQAQLDFDEAHFFVAQSGNYVDNDLVTDDAPWYTEGFVASIDIDRLADIASGRASALRAKRYADIGIPGIGTEVTVVSPTVVDLGMPRIGYIANGRVFAARFVGVGRVDASTTMQIHIGQQHTGGTTANQLAAVVTATANDVIETGWLPLKTLLFLSRGEVSVWAGITSGTGNGYLRGVLQVQQIPTERL